MAQEDFNGRRFMNKKWKIIIIVLVLIFLWIRFSPVIPWTIDAVNWAKRWECEYEIKYEWSWWSLRFTDVYAECNN